MDKEFKVKLFQYIECFLQNYKDWDVLKVGLIHLQGYDSKLPFIKRIICSDVTLAYIVNKKHYYSYLGYLNICKIMLDKYSMKYDHNKKYWQLKENQMICKFSIDQYINKFMLEYKYYALIPRFLKPNCNFDSDITKFKSQDNYRYKNVSGEDIVSTYKKYTNIKSEEIKKLIEKPEPSNYNLNKNTLRNPIKNTIYINLEHRTDRNEYIKNLLNDFSDNVQRLNASYVKDNPALGCCLSHIAAINIAIKNNWENVFIIEDDCAFDFNAMNH